MHAASFARQLAGIAAVSVLSIAALHSACAADMTMIDPADIKWGDAPPVLPKGAKVAVLQGDPSKAGPFIMRLKTPANYKIAPHTHTQAENLTVLSGTLYLGLGDKVEPGKAHALKAGGFHSLPGQTPHYAYSKVPTVVQVNGEGPFDLVYLNPADNPDKTSKP